MFTATGYDVQGQPALGSDGSFSDKKLLSVPGIIRRAQAFQWGSRVSKVVIYRHSEEQRYNEASWVRVSQLTIK